jgi:hypothetical protein
MKIMRICPTHMQVTHAKAMQIGAQIILNFLLFVLRLCDVTAAIDTKYERNETSENIG